MQNVLNNEIKPTLYILKKRLIEDKKCNNHYHYKKKRQEILKKKVGIITVIQANCITFKIEYDHELIALQLTTSLFLTLDIIFGNLLMTEIYLS